VGRGDKPARVESGPIRDTPDERGPRLVGRVTFEGPMPPPALVREYEDILPGAAQFFFNTLDRQSRHRQELEAKVVDANIAYERTGLWLAFFLAVLMICCGAFLIHEDKDPQGLGLIGATIIALAGSFIYGRHRSAKELRAKDPTQAAE